MAMLKNPKIIKTEGSMYHRHPANKVGPKTTRTATKRKLRVECSRKKTRIENYRAQTDKFNKYIITSFDIHYIVILKITILNF